MQAMTMLSHDGFDRILPCEHDATLPPPPNATRIAITVNLHNSAPILPSFMLQLLKLLLDIPAGNAYVLMYESGSRDTTQLWLHMLQVWFRSVWFEHHIQAAQRISALGEDCQHGWKKASRATRLLMLAASLPLQNSHHPFKPLPCMAGSPAHRPPRPRCCSCCSSRLACRTTSPPRVA